MAISPNGSIMPDFSVKNPATASTAPSLDQVRPAKFTSTGQTDKGHKYNVENLRYPQYVGSESDLQHYMVFFINVRGKSKYNKTNRITEVTPLGQNRMSNIGLTTAGAQAAGGALGAAVGGKVASKVLKNFDMTSVANNFLGPVLETVGVGIGAVTGAAGGQALNNALGGFVPDKTFRISDAIMLAVNEKPSVQYGIDYDGKDIGTFMGYLAGGTGAVEMAAGQQNAEMLRAVVLNIANIPSGIANLIGANLDIPSAFQVGAGVAPNPFREQVFRNVETRQFVFDYKFLPRSPVEAANVRKIIEKFKYHMHPEISDGGLFYIYPSTFDIAYYFKGSENKNLHRISTCVLESLNVDYGGQGWNTFGDGMPTELNMRLKFRELEVLTKERIEKGY